MAKILFHFFHKDGASLSLGSIAALGTSKRSAENGVDVEVFICGSLALVFNGPADEGPARTFNSNIDEMIAAGVRVSACIVAAQATGDDDALRDRGVILEDAALVYARSATDGTTVITF